MLLQWAAALLMLAPAPGWSEAADKWIVAVEGRPEVVARAAGTTDTGVPLVDVAALAGILDLTLVAASREMVLRDGAGRTWHAVDGATALVEDGVTGRVVDGAVRILDDVLYLPLSTVADVTGRALVLDPLGRAYLLTREPAAGAEAEGAAPAGWVPVMLEKTRQEREETRRLDGLAVGHGVARPNATAVLPPRHQSLQLIAGAGLVTGEDWAAELEASGSVAGLRLNGALFTTMGPLGLQARNATLLLQSSSDGWAMETGDLVSELRGLGRGLRFAWGLGGRWRQSVSLEQSRFPFESPSAAVAYRTEWSPAAGTMAGAEAATDGAVLLKGRYGFRTHSIDAFWRTGGARDTTQFGGLLSAGIWRGFSAGAGARVVPASDERSYLAGLSVPLKRFGTVSFQQVRTARGDVTHAATGFSASLPIGPLRLFERVQWTDLGTAGQYGGARHGGQQFQSVAMYSPTPRVHLVYQSATQWFPGGAAARWNEIQTSWQVSRSTWIYTTHAVPRLADAERFRIRLSQTVGRASSLSIEYGQLAAFQPTQAFAPDRTRLLVMVRQGFGVRTPARGGVVVGHVLDEAERAVTGAAVRLGPYVSPVNDDGAFRFERVPPGTYEIAVEGAHLPAHYAEAAGTQTLVVGAGTSARIELRAISLHAVHGRVYIDRNRNQLFDRGEGIAGVVVRLGDLATVTDSEGRYTFHTVQPGTHVVRVDRSRLDAGLEPASADQVDVHVLPDGTGGGVDFVLRARQKPVRMQGEL